MVLRYSGLVSKPAQDEIEAIVEQSFLGLSDQNVESTFGELVTAIARRLYHEAIGEPAWSVEDYRTNVNDLIDQLIDKIHEYLFRRVLMAIIGDGGIHRVRSGGDHPPTREDFRGRLRSALETLPAWTHYHDLVRQLEMPQPSSSVVETRPPLTKTEAADQLGIKPVTVRRWIKAGKLKTNAMGLVPVLRDRPAPSHPSITVSGPRTVVDAVNRRSTTDQKHDQLRSNAIKNDHILTL